MCLLSALDPATINKNVVFTSLILLFCSTASYPPPSAVTVGSVEIGNGLTNVSFTWSPVSVACQSLIYIISSNCGLCPNCTINTRVVCSGVRLGECTFAVQTRVCDSLTGNFAVFSIVLGGTYCIL